MFHRNTDKNEITLPIGYDAAFDLVLKAAESMKKVKITDQNKTMGTINFRQGMLLLKMRNPVKFTVNIVKQGDDATIIRTTCVSSEAQGAAGMSSSQRSYEDFVTALSNLTK